MEKEKTLGETLLELPLYGKITFSKKDHPEISRYFINMLYEKWKDSLYSYCVNCKNPNTFKFKDVSPKQIWESFDEDGSEQCINGPIMFSYECAGCNNLITIALRVDGHYELNHDEFNYDDPPTEDDYYPISDKADFFSYDVLKIGQFPTIADLEKSSIDSFRKILPDDKIKEYNTAIRLVSHGAPTGAMTYLRRVFEHLIEDAHNKAKNENPNFDNETGYLNVRDWDKKMALIKDFVPGYMFEKRTLIYKIMSAGIHTLSEKENADNFFIIKTAVDIILSEKFEKRKKKKEKEENDNLLNKTYKKIKL